MCVAFKLSLDCYQHSLRPISQTLWPRLCSSRFCHSLHIVATIIIIAKCGEYLKSEGGSMQRGTPIDCRRQMLIGWHQETNSSRTSTWTVHRLMIERPPADCRQCHSSDHFAAATRAVCHHVTQTPAANWHRERSSGREWHPYDPPVPATRFLNTTHSTHSNILLIDEHISNTRNCGLNIFC